MTKMLKSIIAGAAVLIGACFIGQTQPVQAADDYALLSVQLPPLKEEPSELSVYPVLELLK